MYRKIINILKNKSIAIVGFGKEGRSTYKFIRKYLKNEKIFILDKNENLIIDSNTLINDTNVKIVLGKDYLKNINDYDIIIKSPGISFKKININNFKNKITSQTNLFLEFCECKIIGVTGTKGKSTTASIIYNIIKTQGYDVYLCGNIGIPIFDYIDKFKKNSIVIVEMSAYHTEFIKKSPHISIILNLFEEHLDYFESKESYFESKLNIFKYQNKNDYAIYSLNNETLSSLVKKNNYNGKLMKIVIAKDLKGVVNDSVVCDMKNIYLKTNDNLFKLYDVSDSRYLLGKHNLENIMFAFAVSNILNLDNLLTAKAINDFKPLEHRMEYVGKFNNIIFYNDSIATIPEATINCIETLTNVNTLIFGGLDRKINYSNFVDYLNKSAIKNFICMPETGYKIGKMLINKNVLYADSMKKAVLLAYKVTSKNKICLLSPAASSYNSYKNFEEKGKNYKEMIIELK